MATNTLRTARSLTGIGSLVNRVSGSSLWGFADQAVISATSVITMVVLARALGTADFGLFTLAYTVVMFASSVQLTLITSPHNVLGAAMRGADYASFTTANGVLQIGLTIACVLIVLAGAGVSWLAGLDWTSLLLSSALVVATWQLHEFTRRVLYTHGHTLEAALTDFARYGVQVLGIVALWQLGALTDVIALLVVAGAALVGFVVGLSRIRTSVSAPISRDTVSDVLRGNWTYGKWLLGSTLVSWLSGQFYPLLTAGLVSIATLGATRAVQTLLGPTHILMRGMEAVFIPRASAIFQGQGSTALLRYVRRIAIFTGPLVVAYCLAIAVFAPLLVEHLFGADYTQYTWLVIVIAANYVLVYTTTLAQVTLASAQLTSPMFRAESVSAAIVLTCGVVAVYRYGLEGAAAGMVVNSIVINIVLWNRIRTLGRTGS